MEFGPFIKSLSTEELISIISYAEKKEAQLVEQARNELVARGIQAEEQTKLVQAFKREEEGKLLEESEAKALKSFGYYNLFWMTLRWPFTLLIHWRLGREGYFRKQKERRYTIITGMALWLILVGYADYAFDRSERAVQNEINRADIYEWELENYTDEEITESRKRAIEEVISLVRKNELKGVPTYVILESDTLSNTKVEDLRKLEPLKIRDVIFQKSIKKNSYAWVEIKLVDSLDKNP